MNKTLIVLLAVCLISVHGFVKRDAPEAPKDAVADLTKQASDIFNQVQDQIKNAFEPNKIKENFNKVIDDVTGAINKLKPQPEKKA